MNKNRENTELRYRDLYKLAPMPMGVFQVGGAGLEANHAFCAQLGYELAELQENPTAFNDIFATAEQAALFQAQLPERQVVRRFETQLKTREGLVFPVLISGRLLDFQGGEAVELSFMDISHQKKLARRIRREHTRLASLIENLAAGLFLVSRKGVVTEANMTLGNLLGLPPDQMISKPYQNLFSRMVALSTEPEVLHRWLEEAVLNVSARPDVAFTVRQEAAEITLEVVFFPVRDEAGVPLGWGGLVQDITEMRNQAAWKLELLSMLAHDLRSPLATLKGHSTALLANYKGWSDALIAEFLESINQGVDHLIHQVDRNLSLTRVETGRLGLRPEAVPPHRIISQALERAAGVVEGWRIETCAPDELPQVHADPARVEEVLVNLLENAVRYAPPDQAIQVQAAPGDAHWMQFSVIDKGPGIPTGQQQRIFEKYVKGDPGESGTGLGLYISRKIIEAHGGRLWVQSPLPGADHGTAFHFRLPVIAGMPAVMESVKETRLQDYEAAAERRVLVVEDEPDYQVLLRTTLSQAGYQVEIAPEGDTALKIVQTAPPDLVLLDWVLAGMSGLAVCRSIRRWSDVPIMLLTSRTAQEDIVLALDAGADDYVTKPYQTDELLARIRALLRRGEIPLEADAASVFRADELLIDFNARQVWVRGKLLSLTATEFDLLVYFSRHPRQVLSYDQIINHLWEAHGALTRHAVFVHISRLRKKIERDPKKPRFIVTRWGIGYVFMP